MLIPPINSKGIFKFQPPFDKAVKEGIELTTTAVRSLQELIISNLDPYDTIYRLNKLSEEDYKDDLQNNVPIVVFTTESDDYLYIPGDMILSIPQVAGVKYITKVIGVNIGAVPVDIDLELAIESIKELVYDTLGIQPQIEVLNASAVTLVDQVKSDEYMKLIKNRKTIDKSYKTMYTELRRIYDSQLSIIRRLEEKAIQLGIGTEKTNNDNG